MKCSTSTRRPPPLRRAGGDQPAARPAARWSTSCSTPASSTRTATSTSWSSTPRPVAEDILMPDHRAQPRTRGRRAPRAADPLVPQHLVAGSPRTAKPRSRERSAGRRGPSRSQLSHRRLGERWLHCERHARAAVHRERDQRAAALRGAQPDARTSRTASTTTSCTARATRSTRRDRDQGGRALRRSRSARRQVARWCGSGCTRRASPQAARRCLRQAFDAVFEQRRQEADEFYALDHAPSSRE